MRNAVLSFIIFVIMIIIMSFSISYLNKVSVNLEKLNDNIEEYINDDKWDKAYETSLEFRKRWESYSKNIKLFVNHEEIDNIEIELSKLPQYAKEKNKDESLASTQVLKFLIDHISSLEKINIQNIF